MSKLFDKLKSAERERLEKDRSAEEVAAHNFCRGKLYPQRIVRHENGRSAVLAI